MIVTRRYLIAGLDSAISATDAADIVAYRVIRRDHLARTRAMVDALRDGVLPVLRQLRAGKCAEWRCVRIART